MMSFVIAIIVTAVASIGVITLDSYKDSEIRLQADAIDKALHLYSNNHKGIDCATLHEVTNADGDKTLKYETKRIYPRTLSSGQLTELQTTVGLISDEIKFSASISAKNPGIFRYTAIQDANGDISKYRLEVYLSNGTLYKSPSST